MCLARLQEQLMGELLVAVVPVPSSSFRSLHQTLRQGSGNAKESILCSMSALASQHYI